MAFRTHNVKPAGLHHLVVIRLPPLSRLVADLPRLLSGRGHQVNAAFTRQLLCQLLRVAAEDDVSAAARHVGGDGNGAVAAGLSDDGGLTFVVLGVEDLGLLEGTDLVILPALLHLAFRLALEEVRQLLRVLDGHGAYESRSPPGVHLRYLLHHGPEFPVI